MTSEHKDVLVEYLHVARDAIRWKLEGLGEWDARRPLTPTGLNLLGLDRHVAACAAGYFGDTFGRTPPEPAPDVEADPHADFVAPADQPLAGALAYADRLWAFADAAIEQLELDSPGRVPWWSGERAEVTLGQVLVHMIADAQRHAGQADLLREIVDGSAGLSPAAPNLPDGTDWPAHVERVERTARTAAERAGQG